MREDATFRCRIPVKFPRFENDHFGLQSRWLATAPRAALRPADLPAAPAAEPVRWGTTDLDREIEAFTQSLNQEPAK